MASESMRLSLVNPLRLLGQGVESATGFSNRLSAVNHETICNDYSFRKPLLGMYRPIDPVMDL